MLVDGGVMNNFPVDIMSELCEGGPIIGIYTAPPIEKHKVYEIEDSISGWKVLRNRLNPFAKRMRVPALAGTVLRALDINSAYRMRSAFGLVSLLIQPDVHSYGSLDFNAYQPLIQIGYEATQPQVKAWMDDQANR